MNLEQTPFRSVREWYRTPAVHPASEYSYPGVKQIFYESVPYHGKTTRVFACYSLPEGASAEHPVPGVVLIHGGGGTALADWVTVWNRRGYAAISMDVFPAGRRVRAAGSGRRMNSADRADGAASRRRNCLRRSSGRIMRSPRRFSDTPSCARFRRWILPVSG